MCEQLLDALLECIEISMAAGSVEPLAELFKSPERGGVINSKLKPLIGQVRTVPQVLHLFSF